MCEIPFHTISRLIFFGAWNRIRYHQYSRRFHVVASALASEKSSHLGANPGEEKFVNSIRAFPPSTNQRRRGRQGLAILEKYAIAPLVFSFDTRVDKSSWLFRGREISFEDYFSFYALLSTSKHSKHSKDNPHDLLSYRFPFARECEIKPVASMRIRIAEAILYENV